MSGRVNFQNLKYLARCVAHRNQKKVCPFCGESERLATIDSKYVFSHLLNCRHCHLAFRHPQDSAEFFHDFYQEDYQIDVHMMTDLPDDDRLAALMSTGFSNLREYRPYLEALLGQDAPGARILDYGCSWGYNVFKLRRAGFDAQGFELSRPRALFGRKLGVEIASREQDIRDCNDVFLTSHVIEHLTDIRDLIRIARAKLAPDGFFVAFCPNGSPEFWSRKPADFSGNWGLVHPNYLNIEFAAYAFRDHPHFVATGDWEGDCEASYDLDELKAWDGASQTVGSKRDGDELMIVARLNHSAAQ